jgi:penicillin-binding protein 1A
VKTGTTDDFRDAWTVGYTPSIVVGAWAGNNENTPMKPEIAGFIVAPMWHAFMEKAIAKLPQEYFGEPRQIPEDAKPFLTGNYSTDGAHELLYYLDKNDPLGPSPGYNSTDPQFQYWEYPVQVWTRQVGGQ